MNQTLRAVFPTIWLFFFDLHAMMGIGDRHHANTGRDLETLVPKGGNKIAEKGAQEVNMKYSQSDLTIDDVLEAA